MQGLMSKVKYALVVLVAVVSPLTALQPTAAHAATAYAPQAKISYTFDDGLASAYTQAAPTLKKYGQVGTNYVTTGCIASKNTCVGRRKRTAARAFLGEMVVEASCVPSIRSMLTMSPLGSTMVIAIFHLRLVASAMAAAVTSLARPSVIGVPR